MKQWPQVALNEVLKRSNETAAIEFDAEYHEVTIRLWGKGIVSRGKVKGSDVTTPRRMVRVNQLILSKIDARSGAIGLVPPELDGAIVSNDFPSFDFVDKNKCDPNFMGWLVKSKQFIALCKASSEGTTNRVRIKEERFLGQQIALPPFSEQQRIAAYFDVLAQKTGQINAYLDEIEIKAEKLLAVQCSGLIPTDTLIGASFT